MKQALVVVCVAVLSGMAAVAVAADVTLVKDGQRTYHSYVPRQAH